MTYLALFSLIIGAAQAHDMSEPDAAWYRSLYSNTGVMCCSPDRDCQPVISYGPSGDPQYAYDAVVAGETVHVPQSAVLNRSDNPTGHAVACILHYSGVPVVHCFVRPTEG